jgi:hypothetical protein
MCLSQNRNDVSQEDLRGNHRFQEKFYCCEKKDKKVRTKKQQQIIQRMLS